MTDETKKETTGCILLPHGEVRRAPTLAKVAEQVAAALGVSLDFKLHGCGVSDTELDLASMQYLLVAVKAGIKKDGPSYGCIAGTLMEQENENTPTEKGRVFVAGKFDSDFAAKLIHVEIAVIHDKDAGFVDRLVDHAKKGEAEHDEILALARSHGDVREWLDAVGRVNTPAVHERRAPRRGHVALGGATGRTGKPARRAARKGRKH